MNHALLSGDASVLMCDLGYQCRVAGRGRRDFSCGVHSGGNGLKAAAGAGVLALTVGELGQVAVCAVFYSIGLKSIQI